MTPARHVLERLLRRGESAQRRGENGSLSMTSQRDAGEYLGIGPLPDLEAFHAQIALAEREGAIAVQRNRHGDGEQLKRITVRDLFALARHLGETPLQERLDAAASLLTPWQERFPVIQQVLTAWREGRKVRGCDAQSAGDAADAARVVAARQADAGNERILRRESARLLGHSKRLEKLTGWLDLISNNELTASGLSDEEIWAQLDLRREPQPFRIAGTGLVELSDGTQLPLPRSYLGLPTEDIHRIVSSACYLITIENLASFHEATRLPEAASALLVYTGGFPSPAWRTAYLRLVQSLPPDTPLYHWGDIDEGGFRIATALVQTLRESGRTLRPWLMSPDAIPAGLETATPSPSKLSALCRWAQAAGWGEVVQALQHRPVLLEQESLDAALPGSER